MKLTSPRLYYPRLYLNHLKCNLSWIESFMRRIFEQKSIKPSYYNYNSPLNLKEWSRIVKMIVQISCRVMHPKYQYDCTSICFPWRYPWPFNNSFIHSTNLTLILHNQNTGLTLNLFIRQSIFFVKWSKVILIRIFPETKSKVGFFHMELTQIVFYGNKTRNYLSDIFRS